MHAHTPKSPYHSPLRINGNIFTTILSLGINTEASQHEYSPGSIKVNPISSKLRTYDKNPRTLSPFGQCGMWIQNLELDKTESRGAGNNEGGDLLNHPGSLFQLHKQTILFYYISLIDLCFSITYRWKFSCPPFALQGCNMTQGKEQYIAPRRQES